MTKTLATATVLLVFFVSSTTARAQEDAKTIAVQYKNGTNARVQVLGMEGDKVTLRILVFSGSMELKKRLSDFEPESGFRVEVEATKPTTYEAHLALAKKAAELQLLQPAGAQARAAVAAVAGKSDEEAKTQAVRAWGADTLEGWLHEAVRKEDLRDSEHFLKLLSTRLSDQRTEAQLDVLAGEVSGLRQKARDWRKAERQAKLDARARKAIDRKLEPIRGNSDRGDKLYRQAIAKSRQTTQSANLAEKAIASYRKAWRALESLQKKNKNDDYLAKEAEGIASHIRENAIQSALHTANMLCVRSDYKGALGWTAKILAFDPGNAEAKQLVQTIQIASAADSEWGWGWGRHGGGRGAIPRRH